MINARIQATIIAAGDVLVFWDGHCESINQWAEPLLQGIKESHSRVLLPVIDTIEQFDFHYRKNGNFELMALTGVDVQGGLLLHNMN